MADYVNEFFFFEAVKNGSTDEVRRLLKAGINVDMPLQSNATALYWASTFGYADICKLLLDAGAMLEPDFTNSLHTTPLHIAAQKGRADICQMLLDYGANINEPDIDGKTPLYYAMDYNHPDICRYNVCKLLIEKVDINKKIQGWGYTPLHFAAIKNNIDLCKLLIDKKANLNALDETGNTPLHRAVENKNRAIVQLLLNAGANVNIKNIWGDTPSEIAKSKQFSNIYKLFDDYKMDDCRICAGNNNTNIKDNVKTIEIEFLSSTGAKNENNSVLNLIFGSLLIFVVLILIATLATMSYGPSHPSNQQQSQSPATLEQMLNTQEKGIGANKNE